MKRKETVSCCLAAVLIGTLAMAPASATAAQTGSAEGSTSIQIQKHVIEVSGHMGVGYLSGEANEYVYIPEMSGYKVSELNWELANVYMLNLGGSIAPTSWLKLNADVWFKVNDGNGTMDDYDWFIPGLDYTHMSRSDIDLTEGYILDLNAEFPFYRHGNTVFSALVGYRRDSWEWEAKGGEYKYSTYALYDTVGTLPADQVGITYKQWYDVPYVGVAFHSKLNNVSFMGRLIGSPFAYANDEDTHHLRNLLFEEDFDTTTMWSVDIGGSYDFTPQLSLLAMYTYTVYDEAKGSTTVTNLVTGDRYYYPGDAAGTDHESSLFSLSLLYNF